MGKNIDASVKKHSFRVCIVDSAKERPFLWMLCFVAATLIPILSFFDVPIPKPAWAQDIQRLEIRQLETHITMLEDQTERANHSRLEVLRAQDQIKRSGEPIPYFYLTEQNILDNKIRRLDRDVEAARARKIEISK